MCINHSLFSVIACKRMKWGFMDITHLQKSSGWKTLHRFELDSINVYSRFMK